MGLALPKELLVKIGGNSEALERAGQRSVAVINRIGQRARDTVRTVGRVSAVLAGLAFGAERAFVQPFTVQQEALASLQQALVSTGKTGQDALSQIADEAARLQTLTTAGDEALIKASATLTTLAGSLDADEIARAQTGIVAIADTFLKGDVEQAALLLGKTIGSTTNALSRYGINVDANASASEKLRQVLGSDGLGAAFDVAQAKAQTLNGRIEQMKNAGGDLRETIGEIIARSLGLTEGAEGITARIVELNQRLEDNMASWVGWARVGIESVQFVGRVFHGLIRVAFNVGQVIGRVFDAAASAMVGAFVEAFDLVKKAGNELIEAINKIPGVSVGFRFQTGGANPFLENAERQTREILGDVEDIGEAVRAIAEAWTDVQTAAEDARAATGGMASVLPPAAGGGTGGGVSINPEALKAYETAVARERELARLREEAEEFTRNEIEAERRAKQEKEDREKELMEERTALAIDAVGRMGDAVVNESVRMEVALIDTMRNVVANLRNEAGERFGSTLTGGLLGIGLGIVGSLFQRRDTVPVRVQDVDDRAASKLRESSREPVNQTIILEMGGEEIGRISRVLFDLEQRDEIVRPVP